MVLIFFFCSIRSFVFAYVIIRWLLNNFNFFSCIFSDVIDERDVQSAVYLSRGPRYLPKFGDIITLANGELAFDEFGELIVAETEENCLKRCSKDTSRLADNGTIASWMVEKIRHRDATRGHRYEFRISVKPIKHKSNQSSKRDAKAYVIDDKPISFLLRDDDYPRYFEQLDSFDPTQSIERADRRLFDTRYDRMLIPFQLNYNNKKPHRNVGYSKKLDLNRGVNVNGLNIGEYFARPELFGATAPQTSDGAYHYPPTAFRDTIIPTAPERFNYLPKAAQSNLHRHVYLNKNGSPLFTASAYEQQSSIDPHTNTGAVVFPYTPELPRPTISKISGFNSLARYKGQYIVPTATTASPVTSPTSPPNTSGPTKLSNQIVSFPYDLNGGQKYQYHLEHTFGPASSIYFDNGIPSGPTKLPHTVQYPRIQSNQFRANYAYQPQEYSDPDPLYHGPLGPILVTAANFPSSSGDGLNAGEILSQLSPTLAADYTLSKPITEPNHVDVRSPPPTATSQPRTPPELLITPRKKYPDSINAQLPPGDGNFDFRVPYVDDALPTITEKEINVNIIGTVDDELNSQQSRQVSTTTGAPIVESSEEPDIQQQQQTKKSIVVTTAASTTPTTTPTTAIPPKKAIVRVRSRVRDGATTTEKPVLKWVPKRSHVAKVTKPSIKSEKTTSEEERDSSTTTENSVQNEISSTEDVIIVTPVNANKEQPETSTKFSVSKSVSVRVGAKRPKLAKEKSAETATVTTTEPSNKGEKIFLPTPAPDAINANATQPYIYFNETVSNNPQPDERVVTKLIKAIKKRQRKPTTT